MTQAASTRQIIIIGGADRVKFLHGLVTRDVPSAGLGYSALLSPQGKYLADFFLLDRGDAIWIDAHAHQAAGLIQRLSLYRLRADVTITPADLAVTRGVGPVPEGAFADPRHPAMGWRAYGRDDLPDQAGIDWDVLRVAHCIPEAGRELIPEDSYILEAGFEALGGVDFRKGCYVGQEVTARMKHKTELRKGLARVTLTGQAEEGTTITHDGREIGHLCTIAGASAIAYLRFDRAAPVMQAGAAQVHWQG